MPNPAIPCSDRGALNTRCPPNSSRRSTVHRNTPPNPTSSPKIMVVSSFAKAVLMASFNAVNKFILSRGPSGNTSLGTGKEEEDSVENACRAARRGEAWVRDLRCRIMVGTVNICWISERGPNQATKMQGRRRTPWCMACVKKFSIINNIVLISTCSCSIMQSASFASFASLLVASLLKRRE